MKQPPRGRRKPEERAVVGALPGRLPSPRAAPRRARHGSDSPGRRGKSAALGTAALADRRTGTWGSGMQHGFRQRPRVVQSSFNAGVDGEFCRLCFTLPTKAKANLRILTAPFGIRTALSQAEIHRLAAIVLAESTTAQNGTNGAALIEAAFLWAGPPAPSTPTVPPSPLQPRSQRWPCSPARTSPNSYIWTGDPEPRWPPPCVGEPHGTGVQGWHRVPVTPGQRLPSPRVT